MKISRIVMLVLAIALLTSNVFADNLYKKFSKRDVINVYLKDVKSELHEKHVNLPEFKKIFKETAEKRIEMKFKCVSDPKKADVFVNCTLKGYEYKDKVNPRFNSAYALVADVSAPKNMAKLTADYEVTDKDGKRMMMFKNFVIEDRFPREKVSEEQAFPLISQKSVNRFIYRAFYKQK